MIEANASTVSTSAADDLAFRALADVCSITRELDARIVGGQMVGLLLTAFPTPNAIPRRTADADAALSTQLASTGDVHRRLTDAGYEATSGNSYSKSGQRIDLLVPSNDGSFHSTELGGRAFDSAPGLSLALAAEPIAISVDVTLTDGSTAEFIARVPPVEIAVILKANSYGSRLAERDLTDLHNLLWIAQSYGTAEIGGWQLDSATAGARGDARRTLGDISTLLSRSRGRRTEAPREALVALIRTLVPSAH
ncbi:hypothetical protein [Homoserinibacter sp. GY 40078]|uniref:hypothetical protein n=1 Tax=Homoserinibacter sp. GY 40078 TaxID=2603275 RepID=UPI0011C851DB|nr:hypothetical protein [Homoserinibacter sp. GY 40078]TXK19106.1 hypothetical protein FVQ89_04070 [Homoserinibacter sp. GY 40078]